MSYTPNNNPYIAGDPYSYDLKWIVSKIKELVNNYAPLVESVDALNVSFTELYNYVRNYFDNLDVSDEISSKIDEMAASGELADVIANALDMFIEGEPQTADFTNFGGQTVRIFYRLIPADYTPELFYENELTQAEKFASDFAISCGINAGRFRSNGDYYGYTASNGVTLNSNDAIGGDSRQILTFKGGLLNSVDINTSTEDLDANNYDWAVTGFETIIEEGLPTSRTDPANETGDAYHPRSFIAQNYDGSYIIGCTDGRNINGGGFTLSDIYRFIMSLNLQTRYAYSLDGGGSVALTEKGYRQNFLINSERRAIKTVIGFRKSTDVNKNALITSAYNSAYLYLRGLYKTAPLEGDVKVINNNGVTTTVFNNYELNDNGSDIISYMRTQKNRVFFGLANSFTDDGTGVNALDVYKAGISWFGTPLLLIPKTYNPTPVDYADPATIPTGLAAGVYAINFSNSAAAQTAGLEATDYGRALYIVFRDNASKGILLGRTNMYYVNIAGTVLKLT